MAELTLTGTLVSIKETEVIKENLSKRKFWIEADDQYKKRVCFDLLNHRTDLIDDFEVGDKIKAHFNIDSSEYNGKVYHNISAWKLERA